MNEKNIKLGKSSVMSTKYLIPKRVVVYQSFKNLFDIFACNLKNIICLTCLKGSQIGLKYPNILFCIPITFNNQLKVCFLNKKYPITIQTRPRQIVKVYLYFKTEV